MLTQFSCIQYDNFRFLCMTNEDRWLKFLCILYCTVTLRTSQFVLLHCTVTFLIQVTTVSFSGCVILTSVMTQSSNIHHKLSLVEENITCKCTQSRSKTICRANEQWRLEITEKNKKKNTSKHVKLQNEIGNFIHTVSMHENIDTSHMDYK